MKWNHDELAHDLANKFRADTSMMVWENMQMGPPGSQRPDVYALKKSFVRFQPVTYEVKVSVSDFRSDITQGKWQGYLQYSSAVVFAVPAGLISKNDIPDGCGLIVRGDEGWRHLRKPTLQKLDSLPHDVWMKMLIDGVDRAQEERIKRRPTANEWHTEQCLRKSHGEEVAKLINMALRADGSVERAIARAEQRRNEIDLESQEQFRRLRERMERDMSRLSDGQQDLSEVLGLDRACSPHTLAAHVRKAAERLSRDAEVMRLRKQLAAIRHALDVGQLPLPGEDAA